VSSIATYLWGCAGGFIAFLLIFVLPEFEHLARTGTVRVQVTPLRLIGVVGVMAIYVALSGATAFVIGGAASAKEAIVAGMGWEAVAKGLGSVGSALTAP
jgi:hypothetical protein